MVEGDAKAAREILRVAEGSVVEGVVQRVASVGVFVQVTRASYHPNPSLCSPIHKEPYTYIDPS